MTDQPTLIATRYGLLVAEAICYHCLATTPNAVLWVGDYQELEDGEVVGQDSAALITYVECLDERAVRLLGVHAPWVQRAATMTSGITYWANHCSSCGSVQGDHFVQGVDGPYWPQDEGGWGRLIFVPGDGQSRPSQVPAGAAGWEEVTSRYPCV